VARNSAVKSATRLAHSASLFAMAASLLARIFAQSASISARIIDRILASPAANAARGSCRILIIAVSSSHAIDLIFI